MPVDAHPSSFIPTCTAVNSNVGMNSLMWERVGVHIMIKSTELPELEAPQSDSSHCTVHAVRWGVSWPCGGRLLAVNAIGNQLHFYLILIDSGLIQWRLTVIVLVSMLVLVLYSIGATRLLVAEGGGGGVGEGSVSKTRFNSGV